MGTEAGDASQADVSKQTAKLEKIKALYQSKVKAQAVMDDFDEWGGFVDFDSDYSLHYQAVDGDESYLLASEYDTSAESCIEHPAHPLP